MTAAERAELLALATDLPRLWNHPGEPTATRKRNLRAVLEEIIVTAEHGQLRLKLHWKGGDHTTLEVVKNRTGQHRWKTDTTTEQLLRDLARLLPDDKIASVLNRLGVRTAKDNTWTQQRVRTFRAARGPPRSPRGGRCAIKRHLASRSASGFVSGKTNSRSQSSRRAFTIACGTGNRFGA